MSVKARVRQRSAENSKKASRQSAEMKMPFLQWNILDNNKLKLLLDLPVDQVQSQFQYILGFKNDQTCMKDAALLDYFVSGFWWAKEMNFTCQQISFILALSQQLLDNIKNCQASFAGNFEVFTQIMNASRQSSSSAESDVSVLFDAEQIRSITDYFRISLFQHYRLYEGLFSQQRQKQLFSTEKCIEVVSLNNFISPLEEGLSADLCLQYMNPPRVQTAGQESDEQNEEDAGKDESDEEHTHLMMPERC